MENLEDPSTACMWFKIYIDMSEDVDQALISRTTKTLPIYQEIMEDNELVILNKEKNKIRKK